MSATMTLTIHRVQGLDRFCDGCNALAKVQVLLKSGSDLGFCGHHADKADFEKLLPLVKSFAVLITFHWQKLEQHLMPK